MKNMSVDMYVIMFVIGELVNVSMMMNNVNSFEFIMFLCFLDIEDVKKCYFVFDIKYCFRPNGFFWGL